MRSVLNFKKGSRTSVNFSFRSKEKQDKPVVNYASYLKNFKAQNKQNVQQASSVLNKKVRSSINTPKSQSKKKIKQNNFMKGTISLKNKSPTSTPFVLEKASILKRFND